MLSDCPQEILPLAEEAANTPIEKAIQCAAGWRDKVTTYVHAGVNENQGDQFWIWFWNEIDEYQDNPEKINPGLGIFLLIGCREIYADRWIFANACSVLPRLSIIAEHILKFIEKETDIDTGATVLQIQDAVSTAVYSNAKNHPSNLITVIGEGSWRCKDGIMLFGNLAKINLNKILPRIGDLEGFEKLRKLLQYAADPISLEQFHQTVNRHLANCWDRIGPVLKDKWFKSIGQESPPDSPDELIDFYQPTRNDSSWFNMAKAGVEDIIRRSCQSGRHYGIKSEETRLDHLCKFLCKFDRSRMCGGRVLLDILPRGDFHPEIFEPIGLILNHAWSALESGDIAFLLSLLFQEKRLWLAQRNDGQWAIRLSERWERALARVSLRKDGELLEWLVDKLLELPSESYRGIGLSTVVVEERAAWREEIAQVLYKNAGIRQASIEFWLWCSSGVGADESEFLVVDLLKTQKDRKSLRQLFKHVSRTVQIRARAVGALAEGKSHDDLPADIRLSSLPISTTLTRLKAFTAIQSGRTWIGDSDIESLVYTSVAKVERNFNAEYSSQWAHEEERLVSHFLANLENEFRQIRRHLQNIEVHGFAKPVDIELSYRETTKKEEGGPGIGSDTLGVDIAYILRIETDGVCDIERATLVQCKKLERGDADGEWKPSFTINPNQRDDLIRQTESSFYLFLIPAFVREECWIVPARLVRNLMLTGRKKTVLPRLYANRAARSFAQWITYDLMGLWVGDERAEILEIAKGNHPGRKPRFLVSITIRTGREKQRR